MNEHDDAERESRWWWVERLGGDFAVRLLSGLAMVAIVALFTVSGPNAFATLTVAVSLIVAWEWTRLVNGPESGLLMVVQVGAVAVAGLLAASISPGLGLLALCVGAILALLLSLDRNSLLAGLGVLYAGLPAVSLIWLRSDDPFGLRAVIFLILIVATADTAAFLSGRLLRGPLLWPAVSPKKTWSGLVGALVASAVMGALFWAVVPGGSPLRLAAAGAVLAAVAQAGDLAESALKRRFGAKDTGSLLPGHGGMMDRVDGLVAAAAAVGLAAIVIDMHSPASALLFGS
jgi:phosphatidate cytidylyltransferase